MRHKYDVANAIATATVECSIGASLDASLVLRPSNKYSKKIDYAALRVNKSVVTIFTRHPKFELIFLHDRSKAVPDY